MTSPIPLVLPRRRVRRFPASSSPFLLVFRDDDFPLCTRSLLDFFLCFRFGFRRASPRSQVSVISLDLKALIRVRVRCRLPASQLWPARSSLGLGFLLPFQV